MIMNSSFISLGYTNDVTAKDTTADTVTEWVKELLLHRVLECNTWVTDVQLRFFDEGAERERVCVCALPLLRTRRL